VSFSELFAEFSDWLLKANYAVLLSKPSVSSCPGILNSSYPIIEENDRNRLAGDLSLPDQTIEDYSTADKNGSHRIANNDKSFSHKGTVKQHSLLSKMEFSTNIFLLLFQQVSHHFSSPSVFLSSLEYFLFFWKLIF
jgi:hypothetical protein